MIVTFVDPGQRWTAVVTRDTDAGLDGLRGWQVIDAADLPDRDPVTVTAAVLEEIREQTDRAQADLVAVEAVVAPSSHIDGRRKMIDPSQILVTATIQGAVIGAFNARTVPPAGFGAPVTGIAKAMARQILVKSYPADLIGPRETTGGGKSPLQHARAAWDGAAAAAAAMHRHPSMYGGNR